MSLLPLPADEATRLSYCEQTIAIGLKNFVDVGTALLEIQQHRLYRSTHANFAIYCQERWGMGKGYAYRVMEATKIVGILPVNVGESPALQLNPELPQLSPMGDTSKPLPAPTSERSIRPLSKVPKEKVAETYQRAVEIAGGKAPTAADTEQAVEETRNELAGAMGYTTPEEANEAIEPKPSTAMMHAARAIECLASIDKEDPEWFKAFSKVRKFLNNLETEWEAE